MRITAHHLRNIIREELREEAEAEQISDDPMLIEIEWENGRNEVIALPDDIASEFEEELDRDRWAADSWLTSWLDDEFGGPEEFVSRWRYAETLEDTEIDPELKRWVS